jgi:hypothetical protein
MDEGDPSLCVQGSGLLTVRHPRDKPEDDEALGVIIGQVTRHPRPEEPPQTASRRAAIERTLVLPDAPAGRSSE